jgi:NADPH:quinone reductase-like Zn-dependent oxidoreductase
MRALVLRRNGTLDDLEVAELPTPSPGPGEVLVRVRAAALNRVDQLIVRGYPGLSLGFPHVPGGDFAGEVAALGAGVSGLAEGELVAAYPLIACGECALCRDDEPNLCQRFQYFGMHRHGGYAEYVAAPARALRPLPAGADLAAAAASGVAGLTALHALRQAPRLGPGRVVLVWGATGGVGVFAVQLARALGADVVATTRNPGAAALLTRLGATHVLPSDPALVAERVRALYPAGVDLALDYVGPATFGTSHQLLRKGGTLVLCGLLTGAETTLSIHQTYLRHLRVQGVYLGTRDEYDDLLGRVARRELEVPIAARFPLARGREALAHFASAAHVGKIVLDVA